MIENKNIKTVLHQCDETLFTVNFGFRALKSTNPKERMAGLRNVVVFGRVVTFVLQNLKSIEPKFDAWYENYREEMASDPLMKFFKDLRNKIEKEGRLPVNAYGTFTGNPFELMRRCPRPPQAKSFFMIDHLGGSGWEIELFDGLIIKYYVDIPADIPNFNLDVIVRFSEIAEEFKDKNIEILCEQYISYLENMVRNAKQEFLS